MKVSTFNKKNPGLKTCHFFPCLADMNRRVAPGDDNIVKPCPLCPWPLPFLLGCKFLKTNQDDQFYPSSSLLISYPLTSVCLLCFNKHLHHWPLTRSSSFFVWPVCYLCGWVASWLLWLLCLTGCWSEADWTLCAAEEHCWCLWKEMSSEAKYTVRQGHTVLKVRKSTGCSAWKWPVWFILDCTITI